ncbi:MAG: hypothetical protein IPJ89_00260 [Candidatus Iainarchaeum archaeon]|uniref:Uncharacterized protein n=1 Tax=Candidatus Iainarchaeum sp. TaxID=3101447 RepID=A0A7T9DK12_9ARCH|nr:MAG: hypothetical protein IPJ89_00260 [Candidatus Diapherotrites archaeon]
MASAPRPSRPRIPLNQRLFGAGRHAKMKVPKGKPVGSGMNYRDFLLEQIPKGFHPTAHANLQRLNSDSPEQRGAVIRSFVRQFNAGASRVVKEVLARDTPAVQLEALKALQENWDRTATTWSKDIPGNTAMIDTYRRELMPSLIRLMRSPDPKVQQSAVRLIQMYEPTSAALRALRRFQRDLRVKAKEVDSAQAAHYRDLGADIHRIRHHTIYSLRASRQDARRERAIKMEEDARERRRRARVA